MTHRQPHGPQFLSVGNVISAGIRIYRDHFRFYWLESIKGHLWFFLPISLILSGLIVPYANIQGNLSVLAFLVLTLIICYFYGLARFLRIRGMIGRLAYREVIEKPESVSEARLRVKPRLWSFLFLALLVALIFLGFFIVAGIMLGILFAMTFVSSQANPWLIFAFGLAIGVISLLILFAYIWLFSRLAFADLALAIELVNDPFQAISRSWQLSQGYVLKLQTIYFVAFLITLPTASISSLGTLILGNTNVMAFFVNFILSIFTETLILPFWQAIKAVMYYDLRVRKEGLDLLDTAPEDSLE